MRKQLIKRYFITGLLIWVPLAITAWVLTLIAGAADQSYGVSSGYVQGEGVIVQTAKSFLCGSGNDAGGVGGQLLAATSLPCRVFVRKLEA